MHTHDELAELHHLLISRIYHEDSLLAQRTYNFLTGNAFLAAALAFTGFGSGISTALVILLGVIVALFQIAIGYRNERAILFWRYYTDLVEMERGMEFEIAFYDFNQNGCVELLGGRYSITSLGRKMSMTFPWSWRRVGSANFMVAVVMPLLVFIFWLSSLLIILVLDGRTGIALSTLIGFVIIFVVGLSRAVPGRPVLPESVKKRIMKTPNTGPEPDGTANAAPRG